MELRRAASGLVKVICRTEDSRPNGRGKKPGKPKQKGLLASFEEWFGSINMMNILYVWFPASWGPSVVEAIQTRNVTSVAILAQGDYLKESPLPQKVRSVGRWQTTILISPLPWVHPLDLD